MRIRKQAKLASSSSPLPLPFRHTSSTPDTHVCQLNRSPWDVISFPPPPQSSNQQHHQGNGFLSAASASASAAAAAAAATSASEDSSLMEGEESLKIADSSRMEWKCGKEAKQGHSMSQLPPLRKSDAAVGTHRRNRRSNVSGSSSASDYYYYSGFGPLWGKKRDGRSEKRIGSDDSHLQTNPSSSSSDDEEDDGVYRKRSRKPMKSRSLKSLL